MIDFVLGKVHDLSGVRMNCHRTTQMRHVAFAGAACGARRRASRTATAARASAAAATYRAAANDAARRRGGGGRGARVGTDAVAAVRALRRTFATVVIFLDQMVAGSERHEVSVVGGRRYGHAARASHIGVTQLIGERLQFVGREMIVVPQYVIVRGTRGALDARVTAQVEVKLGGMSDARVHRGARRYVAAAAALLFAVGTEETRVVSLLHGDERDARLIAGLQFHARLSDGHQLIG